MVSTIGKRISMWADGIASMNSLLAPLASQNVEAMVSQTITSTGDEMTYTSVPKVFAKDFSRLNDKQTDALTQSLECRGVDILHNDCYTDIIHPEVEWAVHEEVEEDAEVDDELRTYQHEKNLGNAADFRMIQSMEPDETKKANWFGGVAGGGHEDFLKRLNSARGSIDGAISIPKGGAHGVAKQNASHTAHAHQLHEDDPSIFTAAAAGIINLVMMLGFCVAYGMIMFTDEAHDRHRSLGIRMNLATAGMMGALLATWSKIPIAIGGPDMNPVLFIAVFVDKISIFLKEELKKEYLHGMVATVAHASASLGGSSSHSSTGGRLLAASVGEEEWCTGAHLLQFPTECESYHERLRATTIFMVTLSSLLLSGVFITLGSLRLTRYIAYIPTSIVDAFLSCMGFKVFKYGLKLCKYDPKTFIPAAAVGVPLYFLKAHHIGNPAFIIPFFMLAPVVLFYVVLYTSGGSIDTARKDKLMFAEIEHEGFWTLWTDGIYNYKAIEFGTLADTWPDLLIMVLVCTLDCLVTALRTTETKLPVKIDKNYETKLFGLGNLASALACSGSGYMQLKFNVVNYGIMLNCKDRRAGYIYAACSFCCFFAPLDVINYLPRIFLGVLMFFGGSGFVAEHLWGSREYLSFVEWIQVFIILAVFIWFDILWAVMVGCILCAVLFIAKYAKIPVVAGRPMRGGELQSREQHSPLVEIAVRHLLNSWLMVVRLKGFIFFASVQSITREIRYLAVDSQDDDPTKRYRRLQYVLFDCELLDGLDSSAEKDLQQLLKDLRGRGVRMLWSGLDLAQVEAMCHRGTIEQKKDAFADIDSAMLYIEGIAMMYRRKQQVRWAELHPAFELWAQCSNLREAFEPFSEILRLDIERFGCPWEFVSRLTVWKYKTLLWTPNESGRELFLVHTGAVGLFDRLPSKDGRGELDRPVAVYRHGWFLNREATMRAPTRHYALALEDGELLYWSSHDWCRMNREQPLMASAIIEAAMRQSSSDMERIVKQLRTVHNETLQEEESIRAKFLQSSATSKARDSIQIRYEEDDQELMPDELDSRLEGIVAAQHLEAFGLYDRLPAGEAGALPDLPRLIQHDLEVAFLTYSIPWDPSMASVAEGERVIPWDQLPKALMYAGIFGALLVNKYRVDFVTERQLIHIGHEAALMRLSKKMIVKLYNHLGRTIVEKGSLIAREELVAALQTELLPSVSEQEVNGIANTWEDDGSGMISVHEFMGIVSRFMRRHEQDWNLLRGIRDCLRKSVSPLELYQAKWLTPLKIQAWSHHYSRHDPERKIDEQEAEEMLFGASCHRSETNNMDVVHVLDWIGIAAGVLVNVDQPRGKLPPKPKTHSEVFGKESDHFHHPRSLRQEITENGLDGVVDEEDVVKALGEHVGAEHKRWIAHHHDGHGFEDMHDAICKKVSNMNRQYSKEHIDPQGPSFPKPVLRKELSFGGEASLIEFPASTSYDPSSGPEKKSLAPIGESVVVKTREPKEVVRSSNKALQTHSSAGQDLTEAFASRKVGSINSTTSTKSTRKAKWGEKGDKRPSMLSMASKMADPCSPTSPGRQPWSHFETDFSNMTPLQAGKAKVLRCAKNIVTAAAMEATEYLGLVNTFGEMSKQVMDLRSKPASQVALSQFQKARLSSIDFQAERVERKMKNYLPRDTFKSNLPDTPDARIHVLLEDPGSSWGAYLFSIFMGLCIISSVMVLFLKSLISETDSQDASNTQKQAWKVLECFFTIVFLSEYVLRCAVCEALGNQTYKEFLMRPLNICDLMSILPFFMEMLVDDANVRAATLLKMSRLLRLARVARLARLSNSARTAIFGPISAVFTIIWGIYLRSLTK